MGWLRAKQLNTKIRNREKNICYEKLSHAKKKKIDG